MGAHYIPTLLSELTYKEQKRGLYMGGEFGEGEGDGEIKYDEAFKRALDEGW